MKRNTETCTHKHTHAQEYVHMKHTDNVTRQFGRERRRKKSYMNKILF